MSDMKWRTCSRCGRSFGATVLHWWDRKCWSCKGAWKAKDGS